jgi:hypothetical protein
MVGYSDYSRTPILDVMLADSSHSPFEYYLNHRLFRPYINSNIESLVGPLYELTISIFIGRLLRLFHDSNIGCHVSRLESLTIWILFKSSANLILPAFQYWITSWPTLRTHHFNIPWVVGYSDYSLIPILDVMLADSRHSTFEYWLCIPIFNHFLAHSTRSPFQYPLNNRLLRLFHDSNIGCHVSWVTHHLNTVWIICHSNSIYIPIFNHLLAYPADSPFRYSWNHWSLQLFRDFNIGFHVCRLKALVPTRPLF